MRNGRRRVPRFSKVAITIAGGLVVAVLLWWTIAVPALVKYPTDLDVTPRYEGEFTLLVDPVTAAPLPSPLQVPLHIDRHVRALDSQSDSSHVLVEETIEQAAGDLFHTTQTNVYVMDRRTLQNVADDRAYAFVPSNVVDRSNSYRLNLPFDTSTASTYAIYKNETGTTYEMRADTVTPTVDEAGLRLHKFVGSAHEVPLADSYVDELDRVVSLPRSMTLDQLKPQLKAAGLDVDALVAALTPSITPDDLTTLAQIAAKPIPLRYVLSFDGNAAVETTTGAEVDVDAIESVGVKPVLTDVAALQDLLTHYPDVAPAVAAIGTLADLRAAPAIPVFEYHYGQTQASVADIAHQVAALRTQVRLAELYVPFALLGLAFSSGAVSALVYWRCGRQSIDRSTSRPADSDSRNEEMGIMQEAHGAPMQPLPVTAHLLQPIVDRARYQPLQPVAAYRVGDRFVDVTAAEFYERVRRLAKGLIATGVEAGDRVALMSHSRLEWLLVDYAVLATGAVTVPAYETSSVDQLRWILCDSGAVAFIAESNDMAEMHTEVRAETPECQSVYVIDHGGLDELIRRGRDVDDATLDARMAQLTTDHVATIVYTSGTTGQPKGCVITHGNLRANAQQNLGAMHSMLGPDEVTLIFLPLAHTLTKIIALVSSEWGIKMAFATDVAHLQEELAIARPTMVVAVPRVFEKVFNGAQHTAAAEGHGRLFDRSVDVAIRWSEQRSNGRRRPITAIQHAALQRLVYRKLRAVFGGRLRFAFSGGGPLGERLTHFFNGVGVKILEGYGLTETSPTLTVNRADAWKPGTVGTALAGTSIRIAVDGEIVAKGPQVFRGYWHNRLATVDTFDNDGWFQTGDIGTLDDDGFLKITGRKKEILVTAGGKNVAPAPLEDHLRAHPLVNQALVIGDARPFIAALITLDPDALTEWASTRGLDALSVSELIASRELRVEIASAVDDANRSVSRAESIRAFALLPEDFTIERDELTPTLKVRRRVIEQNYHDTIESLYGGSDAHNTERRAS